MPDNRPAVYIEGNNVIYRASALGHCLRSLWAARSGFDRKPLPEIIQRGMDEGTSLEPVILDLLYEKHGFTFAYQPQYQVELNLGAWNGYTLMVRGKVDEVGHNQLHETDLPIDVKALPESGVKSFLANPWYAWQRSAYIHGYGSKGMYMPVFHKGTWQIVPWSLVPLKADYTVAEIRDRVLQVEEAFYDGKMPNYCDGDYGCAYPYLHDETVTDELTDAPALLARARIKLSKRIESLSQARKVLDDKLKGELDQDVKYKIDGYTVSVYGNPRRFNTDAAKRLLTEAEVEWENDPEFWIPGQGIQVRFTPPKRSEQHKPVRE